VAEKMIICDFIEKCRLCGNKSKLHTGNINRDEMEELIRITIRDNLNQPLKSVRPNSGLIVQLRGTHKCKNGNLGITDLIGVKFHND